MILYIIQYLSDLCASLSYVVAKKFYKEVFCSTAEMFAYCNIYILFTILCFSNYLKKKHHLNLFNIKDYIKNRVIIYITLLSVLTAGFKVILLSHLFNISQLTLRSYSIVSPFITITLCHLFLKDQKVNKSFLLSFLICFVGFLIFNSKTHFIFNFSIILIIYVLFNGYSDYKLKSISSKRTLEMMLFDNLMFLFVSTIIFIIALINEQFTLKTFGIAKFNSDKLFNIHSIFPLFILAMLSFLAHNFKMLSYKAKYMIGIIIVGIFFKAFNSILMTYLEYNTIPTLIEFLGLLIMCIGLSLFVYRNYFK